MTQQNSDDDDLFNWFVLALVGAAVVPALIAKFVPAAQDFLVRWHVLVTDHVLIPIGPTVGLDLARCFIAAAIVVFALLVLIQVLRHRSMQRQR
jgi:hypothetical protein